MVWRKDDAPGSGLPLNQTPDEVWREYERMILYSGDHKGAKWLDGQTFIEVWRLRSSLDGSDWDKSVAKSGQHNPQWEPIKKHHTINEPWPGDTLRRVLQELYPLGGYYQVTFFRTAGSRDHEVLGRRLYLTVPGVEDEEVKDMALAAEILKETREAREGWSKERDELLQLNREAFDAMKEDNNKRLTMERDALLRQVDQRGELENRKMDMAEGLQGVFVEIMRDMVSGRKGNELDMEQLAGVMSQTVAETMAEYGIGGESEDPMASINSQLPMLQMMQNMNNSQNQMMLTMMKLMNQKQPGLLEQLFSNPIVVTSLMTLLPKIFDWLMSQRNTGASADLVTQLTQLNGAMNQIKQLAGEKDEAKVQAGPAPWWASMAGEFAKGFFDPSKQLNNTSAADWSKRFLNDNPAGQAGQQAPPKLPDGNPPPAQLQQSNPQSQPNNTPPPQQQPPTPQPNPPAPQPPSPAESAAPPQPPPQQPPPQQPPSAPPATDEAPPSEEDGIQWLLMAVDRCIENEMAAADFVAQLPDDIATKLGELYKMPGFSGLHQFIPKMNEYFPEAPEIPLNLTTYAGKQWLEQADAALRQRLGLGA